MYIPIFKGEKINTSSKSYTSMYIRIMKCRVGSFWLTRKKDSTITNDESIAPYELWGSNSFYKIFTFHIMTLMLINAGTKRDIEVCTVATT